MHLPLLDTLVKPRQFTERRYGLMIIHSISSQKQASYIIKHSLDNNNQFCIILCPSLNFNIIIIISCIKHQGFQYVHWVMHKYIMVKVGGKRNTRKIRKKQVNFLKTGGNFSQ